MKIKRIDIVGFKSFVDKVSLDFQSGITGVVGPNGCGKSNVVDALRWAMGEQNARNLRGRAMEDVIFGGSESRKPHGMAEVSIVFDNSAKLCPPAYSDYAEIMVTRRLYRSGESEYLLNKTPCRLLEITELFMDTGVGARAYSIIEQGKVGMLVSAKPEERRALIEEAAGVTKYKSRKKTAVRKMEATRQNLVRLSDIISEVRRHLSSLKRQAQRAEKFREYRGEMKRIELCLTGNRFQELQQEIGLVGGQEGQQSETLARLDTQLEEGDLKFEEKRLQLALVEEELTRSQEQVYQLGAEIQRVEGELTLAQRQRESLEGLGKELQQELDGLQTRQAELQSEIQQFQTRADGFVDQLNILQAEVESEEEALRQMQGTEQRLHSEQERCRRQLLELLSENSRLANRREDIARRLAAEQERREQLKSESLKLAEQIQLIEERRLKLSQQQQGVQDRQDLLAEAMQGRQQRQTDLQQRSSEQEGRLSELRQLCEKTRSRRESLVELEASHSGYVAGVKLLLGQQGSFRKIVADLLLVEKELEPALEMVLGERLQALPLDTVESLDGALKLLLEKRARATFFLPGIDATVIDFPAGQPLVELVRCKSGAEEHVKRLLAGTWLVENVREFLGSSLPAGLLLVDRSGNCLSWRGELTGGAPVAVGAGLLRQKRELEELAESLVAQEAKLQEAQSQLDILRDEASRLEEEQAADSADSHHLALQALNFERDRQGLASELGRLEQSRELHDFDLEQSLEVEVSLRREAEGLQQGSRESGQRQQQLESQAEQMQAELTEQREKMDQTRELLTERRVALAAHQQQQQAMRDTLARLSTQQQEGLQRQQTLKQRLATGGQEQQQLKQAQARFQVELETLLSRREEQQQVSQTVRNRFEEGRQSVEELREQLRSLRNRAEEQRKEVARLQLRHHELIVDAEHVRQGVLERYRVDLLEHQVPEATEDELLRQQEQLKRLQQRVEGLGEVNLMAIDEYREQEERYDFLTRQRDDLHQSLEDLQKAIGQINRTTRRRFKETFDKVNETFKTVFPRLFRGGQAELRLTDEEDLLETGIDIVVQPPGKRLQNVNLLSGGEKALTAVALIFSLFLIKPTPFCVLDEVDAPLDDANIDRFAEIVREMTAQSQFIIITHSKRTMAIVDTMYGVTMQEPGVSKLVSVRMNEFLPADPSMAVSA